MSNAISRNVKTPSPRMSIFVTRFAIMVLIGAVIGGLVGSYLGHNAKRHAAYVKAVAASYHYQVGKSYYCWDEGWSPCIVIGVESNYQEYFVKEPATKDVDEIDFHISPVNMAHNGTYYGHTL